MVYIIGEILVDIYQDEKGKEVHPGGAPFNVASNIAYFNGDVTFYDSIGNDPMGKLLNEAAMNTRFTSLVLPILNDRHTSEAIVTLNNGERSFRFNRDNGSDYALDIKVLESFDIKSGDIVHLGSLMLSKEEGRDFFYKAVKIIKSRGAKVSFDVNYRDDIFNNEDEAIEIFKNALKEADIVKLSNDEINVLTKGLDVLNGLKLLLNKNQIAFVSLGKDGSICFKEDIIAKEETKPVKPIDTTGAGDAFYSYVLFALDKGEDDYNKILKYANMCGAMATQKKGAFGVVPSLEELSELVK